MAQVKDWLRDKLLPPLLVGLLVAAVNAYIDLQMLKRGQAEQEKALASLRAELTDLWVQANDQIQKR